MTRFGPKHTSATAILAVSELKQRSSESCADFMDRVLLAVDRTHYSLTPAQKQADGYRQVFTSAAIMHFGAGVRPDIGKVILAQADPPANIADMLAAAEAVEAEQAKNFQNRCNTQQQNNAGPNQRFPRQTRRQGRNAFRGCLLYTSPSPRD